MSNQVRIQKIQDALNTHFKPCTIDLIDEGALHRGHAGAASGHGHFALELTSQKFAGLTPIARQRLVYEALGDLMKTDIHALRFIGLHTP